MWAELVEAIVDALVEGIPWPRRRRRERRKKG